MTEIIDISVVVQDNITVSATVEDQQPVATVENPTQLPALAVDPTVVATVEQQTPDVQVDVGVPGPKGEKGDPGDPGPQGDGLQIDASGDTATRSSYDAELEGFVYLDTQLGQLFRKESDTSGDWSVGVDFGGADGAPGVDGRTVLSGTTDPDDVTDGVDGDFYIRTDTSQIFGPKASGVWPAGVSLVGAAGVDGNTILYGIVDPTTEGNDGDFYIRTDTDTLFGPKGVPTPGVWPAGTSLVGADGADGADGINGADGNTILYGTVDPTTEGTDGDFYINTATSFIFGPKGVPTPNVWPAGTTLGGADGTDGNTILYGTSGPDNVTDGVDGDFFIRVDTDILYGPKAGGVWPAGTSLVGPAGDPGADGNTILYGTEDPVDQGVPGDFYINTTTNTIFGPKALSWPAGTSIIGPPGPTGANGQDFAIGATGTEAQKTNYDSEAEGFSFLATDTSMLYFRETTTPGVWSTGILFTEKGDTGDTGPKGDQGDQGPPGTDGAPGADYSGPQIFAQATDPPSAVDGDIWIDISQ